MRSPTYTITYELFTRHRSAVVTLLDALEKAGVERISRGTESRRVTATLLFVDSDTPLNEVQEVVQALKPDAQNHLIAVATDRLSSQTDWALLRLGVGELINCAQVTDPAGTVMTRLHYWHRLDKQVQNLQQVLVGQSDVWVKTLCQIVEMAQANCPVLILGESGTGKELVAQQMHQLDPRPAKKDCVVVDCTNLMPGLSGSELFGHEKGAFTHALSQREGAVALANDGTLFLDELGELPLPLQAELLRVMQEGMYKRVGSDIWRRAKFRLVCATNRNLKEEVRQGRFREDLYFRVSGWVCQLPSLRDRRSDIPTLAEHFFRNVYQRKQPIDQAVLDFLMLKEYAGNIRELQQLVHRIASKHIGDGPITIGDIPRTDWPDFLHTTLPADIPDDLAQCIRHLLYQGVGLKEMKDMVTEVAKKEALTCESGNVRLAARRLGCSERILQMHLKDGQGLGEE